MLQYGSECVFGGEVAELAKNITENWLLRLPETNPALLAMFQMDDDVEKRDMLPWSGEFVGKYLTSCCAVWRLTKNRELLEEAEKTACALLRCQKEDGYIGPWGKQFHLTGEGYFRREDGQWEIRRDVWDAWAHAHIGYGLLGLYENTGNPIYFDAVIRIAELFLHTFFGEGQPRLLDMGNPFCNLAPMHLFSKLYRLTGERRYLEFALEVEKDLATPPAGDFIRSAMAGKEFFEGPNPRWEYLHTIEALPELYEATGNAMYRDVFDNIWHSIQKTDVHNTGGFSTFEQAMGTPYIADKPVETCCVVAHTALTIDYLRMSARAEAADQLERALLNSTFGSFNPTGRWATYNTPMLGYKRAHYHEIAFQCKPGAPELNCCSVNAPRPVGAVAEWAYLTDGESVYVNYFGESEAELGGLHIFQQTEYPRERTVHIIVRGNGRLKIRIPAWSAQTFLAVNGETGFDVQPGYRSFDCCGETSIELAFDFTPRFESGHGPLEGKQCVFVGPILLCRDGFYTDAPESVLGGDIQSLTIQKQRMGALYEITTDRGVITLCDMLLAGASGSFYTTWFSLDS